MALLGGAKVLTAYVQGAQADILCFNGMYSADWCCSTRPSFPAECWDTTLPLELREACCAGRPSSLAREVGVRFDALQRLLGGPARDGGGLAQCLSANGLPPSLQEFRMRSPDDPTGPKAETAEVRARRLRHRVGQAEHRGRCVPPPGPRSTWDAAAAGRLERLYRALRGRGGVPLSGRVVNLGAGSWEDPTYHVAAEFNLSGAFIDVQAPSWASEMPGRTRFVNAYATKDNLCALFLRGGVPCAVPGGTRPRVDIIKVDVDSCDCALAKYALQLIQPAVIWIELNFGIPPPLRFSRQCHGRWAGAWGAWMHGGRVLTTHGCSLSAAVAEFRGRGYSLYGVSNGQDGIFVHESVASAVGGADVDEVLCYREAYNVSTLTVPSTWVEDWLSRRPDEALGLAWCNLSYHDYMFGISDIPFSLSI